ncbi:MAG: radical SAM protein [Desulfobacterium sp.]|nr:radical SAM protein [Desulfobacterium sp.]
MLLIYPPSGKACEPPAGVALLAGALKHHNISCTVIDANLEAQLYIARSSRHCRDRWTRRATTHLERNLSDLRDPSLYTGDAGKCSNNGKSNSSDRYRQRVMDVNRAVASALDPRYRLTLADYGDSQLSPVQSRDLISSAETFAVNPFFSYFESVLAPQIETVNPFYIGVSVCFLSQALTAFALAGWIRSKFPDARIIMGGGLITSWMSSPLWNDPFKGLVNLMVRGNGEGAILELFGVRPDKDERYTPCFDFCDWDGYLAPGRILPLRTATGCYWSKCRFCPETAEGGRYRPEKPRDVIGNLDFLCNRYSPDYVHFVDDALSPSFLRAMAARTFSFTWYGFVRFTRDLADPEFCAALYRSGCRMLKLGLESGDQAVLDHMGKGTDLETASMVLAALKQAGIATYVYLLFGTESETEAGAEKTLDYVVEHSREIGFLNTAIFNLPRFSHDAEGLETDDFYAGDLSLYLSFTHPLGWERRKVRQFVERRFKKHPAIAPILRRDPPLFTSNHAMFIAIGVKP